MWGYHVQSLQTIERYVYTYTSVRCCVNCQCVYKCGMVNVYIIETVGGMISLVRRSVTVSRSFC